MKRGESSPLRNYPYPHPILTSLLRVTLSGRGWFMTDMGFAVKKPFHTLPESTHQSLWQRFVAFLRSLLHI